ncbi:hypothetical protein PpBr36_05102 [Pyricularia pennisetigena]|uniref:hypothetical protein n=1 Tax=Pyricularia pennisetigena TaxID=1578925 RepID=UPI001153244B|nr:hypothetical protein PpBr36_05102 [Pyricularia pennisetigena]TLS27349.1 hypothetical protein PpBr36_05102 [Pyricularia pennisetigena]
MSSASTSPSGFPLGFPYRQERDGVWGEPTSTLNWCEEDYNITPYIAEFVNTFTNLIFIWLGVKGIRNCIANGFSPALTLSFVGYVVIGLGSMAFHGTLWYSMQLADELPMIWTVCVMAQVTFSYGKSKASSMLLGLVFAGVAAFVTIYYVTNKNPVFHQVAYASITIGVVVRGALVTKYELEPALKKRSPLQADKIMKQMWTLMTLGISLFLIAFAIWVYDRLYCRQLVSWRSHVLLPWSVVLEGHGWWHILTGLGAYNLIVWRVWLSCCLDGKEDLFELRRTTFLRVPEVVPIGHKSNGVKSQKPKSKRT